MGIKVKMLIKAGAEMAASNLNAECSNQMLFLLFLVSTVGIYSQLSTEPF